MGDPRAVRIGPGILKIAPLGTTEPTDLATNWDALWTDLGYTDEGSNFIFDQTFENVEVAEELDPIIVLQTAREITANFALAEITAENLERAFNGGVVETSDGVTTFEPPAAGDYTEAMIGWESTDGLERWIFRKAVQVGSVDIPRKKAPEKAVIPCSFRCTKPAGVPAFKFIQSADYAPLGS